MHVWGIHVVDLVILGGFLVAILAIGVWVSRGVKQESDFYLGGRTLGRPLQFFLNFGNSTDSTGAVTISSNVFTQGVGGFWLGFQTLFITPFFWFTQPWFRRARLTTMADLFVDRFNSQSLATAYALFNIFIALFLMGMGNVVAFKVTSAMVTKPTSAYTPQERQSVDEFNEYHALTLQKAAGALPPAQAERYAALDSMNKRGDLHSFISYIRPVPFYLTYSAIVAVYIILGGLKAAAITDAIQGLLILVMSVILIPVGLSHIGGLTGLHQMVPAYKFQLFGTIEMSDYAWYTIVAIFFTSLVQILGLLHNMAAAGSAVDEDTARFGMIVGGFTKRLVLIAWMLCGLIAFALLSGGLSDPNNAWGTLSKTLLGPGLLGLMLSGMLLGHMPSVGVSAVAVSGLITRNLYEPLVRGRSPRHYLRVGQAAIAFVLLAAIALALASSDVVAMQTMLITFNTFFGAAVFLIFFWRRLTAASILLGLIVWVVLLGVVPFACPQFPAFRRQPALLLQTPERTARVLAAATAADVAVGQAARIGQTLRKPHVQPARSVFFDQVARIRPQDPTSAMEGVGRFNVETYTMHLLGVPVQTFTGAGLLATRWLFDGLFPFFLLIVFSLFTRPCEARQMDGFYAKLKTPVAPTPELDCEEVRLSYSHPQRFNDQRMFARSNWEFVKWTRKDVLGFFGCWGVVGLILVVLWVVLSAGA